MSYGEFIDLVCRLTIQVYKTSEMDGLQLEQKMRYMLEYMLRLVDEAIKIPPDVVYQPFATPEVSSDEELVAVTPVTLKKAVTKKKK